MDILRAEDELAARGGEMDPGELYRAVLNATGNEELARKAGTTRAMGWVARPPG